MFVMSSVRIKKLIVSSLGNLGLIAICFAAIGTAAWAQKKKGDGKPEPQSAAATNGNLQTEYRVGPGDTVDISVWKEPEVSGTVIIRPDGKISLPLVNEVDVNAKTPTEIQALLTQKLDPFINQPNVTVTVKDIKSKKVYVLGQVVHTGVFDIAQPKTVLQIITEAGGPAPFAKQKGVYILRLQDGKQQRLPFNYKEVVKGKNIEQNVMLQPGDTVVVP
jgi:polysaccharide biosynthesis/export protein